MNQGINKDNNPDIDALRALWQRSSVRIDALEDRNAELMRRLQAQKLTSKKTQVERYYRFCGIFAVASPLWFLPITDILPMSALTIVLYLVFMIAAGIFSLWFARYITRTDLYSLPVADAVCRMLRIDSIRHRAKIAGGICCIPVVALLLMDMSVDTPMLVGGMVGGICGGIVGLAIDCRNRNLIRQIAASLEADE